MVKESKLGWVTDRKDLVEAVRQLQPLAVRKLLVLHMKKDARTKGLGAMRHEQLANLLMVGLLEGLIPESTILPCAE
jgi:hypothetical protein